MSVVFSHIQNQTWRWCIHSWSFLLAFQDWSCKCMSSVLTSCLLWSINTFILWVGLYDMKWNTSMGRGKMTQLARILKLEPSFWSLIAMLTFVNLLGFESHPAGSRFIFCISSPFSGLTDSKVSYSILSLCSSFHYMEYFELV